MCNFDYVKSGAVITRSNISNYILNCSKKDNQYIALKGGVAYMVATVRIWGKMRRVITASHCSYEL